MKYVGPSNGDSFVEQVEYNEDQFSEAGSYVESLFDKIENPICNEIQDALNDACVTCEVDYDVELTKMDQSEYVVNLLAEVIGALGFNAYIDIEAHEADEVN